MNMPSDFSRSRIKPVDLNQTTCVFMTQDEYDPHVHSSADSIDRHLEHIDVLAGSLAERLEGSSRWKDAEVERLYGYRTFGQWLRRQPRRHVDLLMLPIADLGDGARIELSNIGTLRVRITYGHSKSISGWEFGRNGYLQHVWDYARSANATYEDAARRLDHVIAVLQTSLDTLSTR